MGSRPEIVRAPILVVRVDFCGENVSLWALQEFAFLFFFFKIGTMLGGVFQVALHKQLSGQRGGHALERRLGYSTQYSRAIGRRFTIDTYEGADLVHLR